MAVVVIVFLVGGAGVVLVRHVAGSAAGPEDTVRAFFEALSAGDCEDAGEQLTGQSLAWLAEEYGPGEFDEDAGHAHFVQQCEETIAVEQEDVEVVSTETLSERRLFATVRVVVRRSGGAEQSSDIDLVDEIREGWGVDLSSLDEVLGMPELATIPESVDPDDIPPRLPMPRAPRRR